ncbi:hypothetical protein DOTSEDRAFT_138869 [Dothistroma septosporum NZE10]|uniref:Pyruvate decarboxylase n=1 Tax=Dothistroma septosporum (strain NZE10 / CBS 128990) TaxID=675120 RepID=M2YKF8_DOTSN|nr:hypothetical protein DOTSEDRAFT_138869 [Dothistroma septosporum NZE10]
MARKIPLAQHLFARLRQLNCHSIHGVPGDFMLRALDLLPQSGVRWTGNASELCAGYAADGYARSAFMARLTHRPVPRVGALFTTYGVGELSAINAVAGAYSENVPVVHFVGTPSRRQWREKPVIHHSLGDGRLDKWAEMAKQITCAQADLGCGDPEEAVARYDEVLRKCVEMSRPVYVNLPVDMVGKEIDGATLGRPLLMDRENGSEEDKGVEEVVSEVVGRVRGAKQPLVVADGLSYPFDFVDELNELVRTTQIPAMCFNAGKGLIDESLPSWRGPLTSPIEGFTSADLVLLFGPLLSDTNTAAWSLVPDPERVVSFHRSEVNICGKSCEVDGKQVLRTLVERLKADSLTLQSEVGTTRSRNAPPAVPSSSSIKQDDLWRRLSLWLKPHDIVLLANGTPLIGGRDITLPHPVQVIASGIWCSIGSMLPAAQGVAAARQDHGISGRTILLEGDGSFQVTCQSISDIIRHKLNVTIIIANNAGYAYERWLNGMTAEYNDVPSWQYTEAPRFFGAKENDSSYPVHARRVQTWGELERCLDADEFAGGRGLTIIDIVMAPDDVPEAAKAGLRRASQVLSTM